MGATAQEVAWRQAAAFTDNFNNEAGRPRSPVGARTPAARAARSNAESAAPLVAALRIMRDGTRQPLNTVWHELLVAARTDPELGDVLRPLVEQGYELTLAMARQLPGHDAFDPQLYQTLVFSVVHLFNGEALSHAIAPMPEVEEHRLQLLTHLLTFLGGQSDN